MKKVLITGATGAIGEACARYFSQNGYFVYIHYHSNKEKADTLVGELGNAQSIGFDISSAQSVKSALDGIVVDVLVNNAGKTKDKLFFWLEEDDWNDVLQTNLTGTFYVTKALLPAMQKNKKGSIVNIASVAGVVGNAGQTNYAASKGGMIAMSKSLALEVARHNIRVNCVVPGFIHSEMTAGFNEKDFEKVIPMKRFGKPQEVAEVVYFLADKATYMTADVVNISGGMVR
ncbi:MAG: SDR family NAD(P)-dependent oxidoreductase [Sulfurovaceae bacterium]|nr:SDR family NAD(P)-dependent oxidoreductase [Sulfurovaceae bacterium]MDD5549610.1 SDR family NAD(P)-dependent oxidoreductase [Sulfurovaceae bacterium]